MHAAPTFGDNVRIATTPATIEAGWAGREGTCYGWTTPSVTDVEVIGRTDLDYAVNVGFDEPGVDAWFDVSLVEVVDHAGGTTMSIGDKHFVRNEDGSWLPAAD